jgi:hypothetical protein
MAAHLMGVPPRKVRREVRALTRAARFILALFVLVPACTEPEDGPGRTLVAEVASFDLAVDTPGRFIVGLGTSGPEGQLYVSGGSVDMSLFYLGESAATGRDPYLDVAASFLPLPGSSDPVPSAPSVAPGSSGRGVYAVERLQFDRPGFWEVEVTAAVGGEEQRATSAFQVLPEHLVPAPGDRAPRTDNLTLSSNDAPGETVDSRAATGEIPDPELHRSTVAEAISARRPAVVVISTPVYCVSRFCGPVTDMVQELAADYSDKADFIHIEVWRDFEGQVVNKAAAEWILREEELREPWVFLVGVDGTVVARWDNVATRQEIEPFLRDLPQMGNKPEG